MRALEYAFRQGAGTLWRSRGSSAFAVLAITLALVVLGALLLLTWNAQQLLSRWTTASEFSVYLADDATSEQRGAIESAIDQSGISAGRDYVSKAQALSQFRQEFAELASLAEGFEDNPFPASIEVRVVQGAERDGRVETLVNELIGRVADKWTLLVLEELEDHGTCRFTELSRLVPGISQKMLTQTLRAMERDGLVVRTVHPVVPPKVEYELTELGCTLHETIQALVTWTEQHQNEIAAARAAYDARQAADTAA